MEMGFTEDPSKSLDMGVFYGRAGVPHGAEDVVYDNGFYFYPAGDSHRWGILIWPLSGTDKPGIKLEYYVIFTALFGL